jgi:hypothetical protein
MSCSPSYHPYFEEVPSSVVKKNADVIWVIVIPRHVQAQAPGKRLYCVILIIRCIVVLCLKDTWDRYSFYNYLVFPRFI